MIAIMVGKNKETWVVESVEGTERHEGLEYAKRTSSLPALASQPPHAATGDLRPVRMEVEGTEEGKNRQESAPSVVDEKPVEKPNTETATQAAVTSASGADKPAILIVEDTTELAEVIQATLENVGMAVDWVSHGSKGLDKIKSNTPDVLLLDIGLPDMTGWKMLEEVRDWKKSEDDMPAVVVITAYGDPANRLIGKLQGIHSYLIKPFTPDEVEKVVQRALSDRV